MGKLPNYPNQNPKMPLCSIIPVPTHISYICTSKFNK
jgi:hypothetical protein